MESSLSQMEVGKRGRVLRVEGESSIKRRLLDMGVVPGVIVQVENVAPLGDPIDVLVKGYHLSLRREEADCITLEMIG